MPSWLIRIKTPWSSPIPCYMCEASSHEEKNEGESLDHANRISTTIFKYWRRCRRRKSFSCTTSLKEDESRTTSRQGPYLWQIKRKRCGSSQENSRRKPKSPNRGNSKKEKEATFSSNICVQESKGTTCIMSSTPRKWFWLKNVDSLASSVELLLPFADNWERSSTPFDRLFSYLSWARAGGGNSPSSRGGWCLAP